MPLPIKSVQDRDSLDGIFHYLNEDEASTARGLSELQQAFLASTNSGDRVAARKTRLSDQTIQLLESIHKNEDEVVTAASEAAGIRTGEEYYRVPSTISDYEMTALKAQGLLEGRGRVVAFTEDAKVALRDHWLKQPSILAQNRTKTRFIHPDAPDFVAQRISSAESTGKRFASKEINHDAT